MSYSENDSSSTSSIRLESWLQRERTMDTENKKGCERPPHDGVSFAESQDLSLLEAEAELNFIHVWFKTKKNAQAHHTSNYKDSNNEKETIDVLRRGQAFTLFLKTNRHLQNQDHVRLQFLSGLDYSYMVVELSLVPSSSSQGWHLKRIKQSDAKREVKIIITSPPDAMVGKYKLCMKRDGSRSIMSKEFFIIFNPWCAEDTVFMPNEEDRAEHVLNDTGYIYMGFAKQIKEKPWTFGQFEKHILHCCFSLLTHLQPRELQSPVLVSRSICTMMCAVNNGVLVGNWSGDYSNGTAPYVWTSSVPILQQHYVTGLPVCFGQCWVFSGILTTALRAVGIPARSVTNFESAHDTGKNLTVDIYLDDSGQTIGDLTKDSVWNFHVWADAWMKRPDLPQGNDGWQVLDSTPQEISDGSPEERKAMERASGRLHPGEDQPGSPSTDSSLRVSVIECSVEIGHPIILTLVLERKTATPQTVNISCYLNLQTYTGKKKKGLGIIRKSQKITNQESQVTLTMDTNSYIHNLGMVDDELVIKGFIITEIAGSRERVATEVTLCFLYQGFHIEMPSTGKVHQELLLICKLKNTLPIPLTNMRFSVESLGIVTTESLDQGTLPPGQSLQFEMRCIPMRTGPRKIIVRFTSREVKEVHVEKMVLITD
ncbi:protein-glutamine gamma-glutamyltransferase 4 isoform X3 [Nannospalax galili]|uniref:protein-glutamine gamma-glutamyltransferase 4 isoform X3 n=1 Tax=Nannospalax galili TaxID=1026970 RepID=UPI0004ECFF85|nr:protein-glutamine gamma-glutamyltransferase 4 isoform X3 [Nannospalax galili]